MIRPGFPSVTLPSVKQRAKAANEPSKIMENERVASVDEIISSIVCARHG
jgi:hypothetical protein